jgi:hypothetical protein
MQILHEYSPVGPSVTVGFLVFQAGSTNGVLSNGYTTDSAKSNGHVTNGYSNGRAADYYVNASTADLHLRSTTSIKGASVIE